jgi:hypothetical protein
MRPGIREFSLTTQFCAGRHGFFSPCSENDGLLSPNRPDDPEYLVRLIGQVITVSAVLLVKEIASLRLLPE